MRVLFVTIALAAAGLGITCELRAQTAATFGQVIKLGATPSDVVLDESRHQLYLVNTAANRVDIFSTTTNAVTGSISVGQGPLAAAMSRDNRYLYVTNAAAGTANAMTVIDLTVGGVSQTVPMPATPQGVAVGGDGTALISTLDSTGVYTLVRFDGTQTSANQLTPVPTAATASRTGARPFADADGTGHEISQQAGHNAGRQLYHRPGDSDGYHEHLPLCVRGEFGIDSTQPHGDGPIDGARDLTRRFAVHGGVHAV